MGEGIRIRYKNNNNSNNDDDNNNNTRTTTTTTTTSSFDFRLTDLLSGVLHVTPRDLCDLTP